MLEVKGDFHECLKVWWLTRAPPRGRGRLPEAVGTEERIGEGDEHAHDADEGHLGGFPHAGFDERGEKRGQGIDRGSRVKAKTANYRFTRQPGQTHRPSLRMRQLVVRRTQVCDQATPVSCFAMNDPRSRWAGLCSNEVNRVVVRSELHAATPNDFENFGCEVLRPCPLRWSGHTAIVIHIRSAIFFRFACAGQARPDCYQRCEQELKMRPSLRFAFVPEASVDHTIPWLGFLSAVVTFNLATAESEELRRNKLEYNTANRFRGAPSAARGVVLNRELVPSADRECPELVSVQRDVVVLVQSFLGAGFASQESPRQSPQPPQATDSVFVSELWKAPVLARARRS